MAQSLTGWRGDNDVETPAGMTPSAAFVGVGCLVGWLIVVGAGEEVILMVCSAEKGSEIILITVVVVVDGMAPPESDNDDCWLSYI